MLASFKKLGKKAKLACDAMKFACDAKNWHKIGGFSLKNGYFSLKKCKNHKILRVTQKNQSFA